jgi:hypothetical protein
MFSMLSASSGSGLAVFLLPEQDIGSYIGYTIISRFYFRFLAKNV